MSKVMEKLPAIAVVVVLVAGVGVIGAKMFGGGSGAGPSNAQAAAYPVAVDMPSQLSPAAARGQMSFATNCASCHGANGSGSDAGPPLVHDIYNPGHHADEAFFRAAKNGVQRHHWSFGDMPPQPQVTDRQIADIVTFMREVQKANGITYRPHQM